MDRYVLDDIGGHVTEGHFAQNTVESEQEIDEIDHDDSLEIQPPMDFITLRNSSTIPIHTGTSNIITDLDQQSMHSGITIVPSCSSSSMTIQQHQQCPPSQDSANIVSMIDETNSALSINANSIDSSVLTEISSSHLISSVNSCGYSESSREEQSFMDFDVASNETTVHPRTEAAVETGRWYNRIESEEDWYEFKEKAKQLLDAVDCPLEERDEFIAQLISMEEQMFWNSDSDRACETRMHPPTLPWLLEVAALSASIALAGVVIVRFLKCR